ncbi:hypothetical protein HN51_042276 [Arachis hypogaea]
MHKKLEVLGAGSYGTVYLDVLVDEQIRFHSFIVVKSSVPKLTFSLKQEEQIFKSVWESKSGGCQEIIQCFRTETTVEYERCFYNLFLEYAPHGSLADLIHKKPLPEAEVSVYARMIVKRLSHIYRKEIVDCDLKPENILVITLLKFEALNPSLFYILSLRISQFTLFVCLPPASPTLNPSLALEIMEFVGTKIHLKASESNAKSYCHLALVGMVFYLCTDL